jgi:hypothetical protein
MVALFLTHFSSFFALALVVLALSPSPTSAVHEHHREYPHEYATTLWKTPRRVPKRPEVAELAQPHAGKDDYWNQVSNISTELHDQRSEYTGEIGVGTDPNGKPLFKALVVFDTGSTNLWVASVLCKDPPCDNGKSTAYYDPHKSLSQETYPGNHQGDIDIKFGTGELKGPLHCDTYSVGPMQVSKQCFAMIRQMNGHVFSSFQFEGILGLAFKSLSFEGIQPFFEHVIEQKKLQNNEFAFYLNTDANKPSALLWGGVDKDLYQGPITMFPVSQPHYWALELVEFRVNDQVMGGTRMPGSPLKKLFIDSGTTYFTAPKDMFEVTAHMPDAPCKNVENYKPMVYVLRGAGGDTFELVITQETYMVGSAADENRCRSAFMPLDVNNKYGPALILGEVFMRHFFTVFSRGDGVDQNAKIGFAQAKIDAPVKVQAPSKQSRMPGANAFNDVEADLTQERSISSLRSPLGARRYVGHLHGLRGDEEDLLAELKSKDPSRPEKEAALVEPERKDAHSRLVRRETSGGSLAPDEKPLLRKDRSFM